jgi:hypothetical protein
MTFLYEIFHTFLAFAVGVVRFIPLLSEFPAARPDDFREEQFEERLDFRDPFESLVPPAPPPPEELTAAAAMAAAPSSWIWRKTCACSAAVTPVLITKRIRELHNAQF